MHKKYHDQVYRTYKKYSRAYFQEIIVKNNTIDDRTIFLFKQKFLKTTEDIDSVMEMYS